MKKKFDDIYKNKQAFSLQNNNNLFGKSDNDWDVDADLDNLMNDKIPDIINGENSR